MNNKNQRIPLTVRGTGNREGQDIVVMGRN